jgi:hypothetical protein
MYEGPGMYQHYKGGYYLVFGIGGEEGTPGPPGRQMVVYVSMSHEHMAENLAHGNSFKLRPLNIGDEEYPEDKAFNRRVFLVDRTTDPGFAHDVEVPRFKKVA